MSQPQTTSLSELAEVLTGDQTALVDAEAPAGPLRQVGAAVLPEPFPMPVPGADDPVHPVGGEPVIELFQVDERGRCEAAGPSEAARAWWWPQAQALVDRVLAALIPLGVVLEYPYVTASATPLADVATGPHLDEARIELDRGVGVVAIAASHGGPRVARGRIALRTIRPPAPIVIEPSSIEAFESGTLSVQETPGDHVVLFAQFGQLHAGPRLVEPRSGEVRNLLVLRAGTRPTASARARRSGPAVA